MNGTVQGRLVVIEGCSGSGKSSLARGDRMLEETEPGFRTPGLHLVADRELDTTHRTPAELVGGPCIFH